ncbi:hypothetical protein [Nonomuraea sp. NPDC050310]|uniref:hypothetical protein n=1 Tax=Nonomuraea sp. NPDC050310 TaxID=3154935 RepID=UPI00340DFFE8
MHARQRWGHELLGLLMEPGTYAVDPHTSRSPGEIVITPGDLRGTVMIPANCEAGCCGPGDFGHLNTACARCGNQVATRVDDCGQWQCTWLHPSAVRAVMGPEPAPAPWHRLRELHPGIPAVDLDGVHHPMWAAAIGESLAHLLAASHGTPITVPPGPLTGLLRRTLDTLLPRRGPAKTLVLAGPDLPLRHGGPEVIALVPRHPQTGLLWHPHDDTPVAPLAADVWTYLTRPDDRLPTPASGTLHRSIHLDHPSPPPARLGFEPDYAILLRTLARLPQVSEPWLRAAYDRLLRERPYTLHAL